MIRPDLALICENMLMSEGFKAARPLSIKFVTLYQLSSELLSPQVRRTGVWLRAYTPTPTPTPTARWDDG